MEKRIRAFEWEIRTHAKIGRNEKCKCGSGLKYKHCCKPKGIVFKKYKNPESEQLWTK